jgi:phenylalanyl-tRNA synthetase beta chain
MRVPLEWLREYVAFEDTPQGLAGRLTFGGIEVEAIEPVGSDFAGLIVGEVRAVERHPNADRLTVCRVFDGAAEIQVVCGAPNVKAGGRYPFAPEGATLPNGMKIKAAKLRGVESHGMLCAEDELGLSEDHAGLMDLPADVVAGTPLVGILGGPDTVLDLEITPNRPDCLSLLGVAREVAALYRLPLRPPSTEVPEFGAPVYAFAGVDVRDADLCPRYTARVIRGLRIGPSPRWMQNRLSRAGVRPINNAVDVTNYVMLEMGQPLHAFDHALLKDGHVVVRRAAEGEVMCTLDGQERKLAGSMLVIADPDRAVAVAGVMGGAGSEVRDGTSTILLESACFQPAGVRATSKALGLVTESSYRFARGVDPDLADRASRRAAALLADLGGGTVAPGVIDRYPAPAAPRTLSCRVSAIRRTLGIETDAETVSGVLRALDLGVAARDADTLDVTVPTFRGDLRIEVDLVEEFARLHGLDRIPARTPAARVVDGADDRGVRAAAMVRDAAAGLGLTEIMNYSLTSEALLDRFGLDDAARRIRLPNPLSAEQSVLRPSLIPQLVETLGRNRAHQVADAAFIEFGRTYEQEPGGPTREAARLAIGLMGAAGRGPLARRPAPEPLETFRWMKGILAGLLGALRGGEPALRAAPAGAFEPGQSFLVTVGGADAGRCGVLRRRIAAEWRIYDPVVVAELDLDALTPGVHAIPVPKPPPTVPCSVRDLAFVLPRATRHEDVMAAIRGAAPAELERIELFDIYEGRGIPADRKSMAYSLTYRAAGRTLTDDEVQRFHQSVADAVVRDLKAEIRDA